MVDQMSPEMIKWSIWVPVAAFIAMQASMRQTGNMITGYTNEMVPTLFFEWWALLLVVGEIIWYILGKSVWFRVSISLGIGFVFGNFNLYFKAALITLGWSLGLHGTQGLLLPIPIALAILFILWYRRRIARAGA